jgi:YD repeat-containing protein
VCFRRNSGRRCLGDQDAARRLEVTDCRDGNNGSSVEVASDFGYDAAGRITSLTHSNATTMTTLADYDWTWDAASRLTQEVSNDGTVNYGYDDTNQLTSASGWRSESYSYDLNGNRTMTGWTTGADNRLTASPGFTYTYDDEGNLLTKTNTATGDVTTNEWDHRNRLVSVTVRNSSNVIIQQSNYTYDVQDRLIKRVTDADGAGSTAAVTQWTVYDGLHAHLDLNGSGNVTVRYLQGQGVDSLSLAWSRTEPSAPAPAAALTGT